MEVMKEVLFEELCKCERCDQYFDLTTSLNLPRIENVEYELQCPLCMKNITYFLSCGRSDVLGGKGLWIGPNGEWTGERPTKAFEIGGFKVTDALNFHRVC